MMQESRVEKTSSFADWSIQHPNHPLVIIDAAVTSTPSAFLSVLRSTSHLWDESKINLNLIAPILKRFDELLAAAVPFVFDLSAPGPVLASTSSTANVDTVPIQTIRHDLVLEVLRTLQRLLRRATQASLFNSSAHLTSLIGCPDLEISLLSLLVIDELFTHSSVAGQSGLRRRHRTLLRDLATLASSMWDPRLVSELPSPNKYHSVLSLLGSVHPLPDEAHTLSRRLRFTFRQAAPTEPALSHAAELEQGFIFGSVLSAQAAATSAQRQSPLILSPVGASSSTANVISSVFALPPPSPAKTPQVAPRESMSQVSLTPSESALTVLRQSNRRANKRKNADEEEATSEALESTRNSQQSSSAPAVNVPAVSIDTTCDYRSYVDHINELRRNSLATPNALRSPAPETANSWSTTCIELADVRATYAAWKCQNESEFLYRLIVAHNVPEANRFALLWSVRIAMLFSPASDAVAPTISTAPVMSDAQIRQMLARINLIAFKICFRVQSLRHHLQALIKSGSPILDDVMDLLKCGPQIAADLQITALKTLRTAIQNSSVVRSRLAERGYCTRGGLIPSLVHQSVAELARFGELSAAESANTATSTSTTQLTIQSDAAPTPLFNASSVIFSRECVEATLHAHVLFMLVSDLLQHSSFGSRPSKQQLSAADILGMVLAVLENKSFRYMQVLIPCAHVLTKINAHHSNAAEQAVFQEWSGLDILLARLRMTLLEDRNTFPYVSISSSHETAEHGSLLIQPPASRPYAPVYEVVPMSAHRLRNFAVLIIGQLTIATGRSARNPIRFATATYDGTLAETISLALRLSAAATTFRPPAESACAAASNSAQPADFAAESSMFISPASPSASSPAPVSQAVVCTPGQARLLAFANSAHGASLRLSPVAGVAASPSDMQVDGAAVSSSTSVAFLDSVTPTASAGVRMTLFAPSPAGSADVSMTEAASTSTTTAVDNSISEIGTELWNQPLPDVEPDRALSASTFFTTCQLVINLMQHPQLLTALHDGGVVMTFLRLLNKNLLRDGRVLRLLPELLRSFALSAPATQLMLKMTVSPLHILLDVFVDPHWTMLLDPSTVGVLAKSLDELLRHVPAFKPIGLTALGSLLTYLMHQQPQSKEDLETYADIINNVARLCDRMTRRFPDHLIAASSSSSTTSSNDNVYCDLLSLILSLIKHVSSMQHAHENCHEFVECIGQLAAKQPKHVVSVCTLALCQELSALSSSTNGFADFGGATDMQLLIRQLRVVEFHVAIFTRLTKHLSAQTFVEDTQFLRMYDQVMSLCRYLDWRRLNDDAFSEVTQPSATVAEEETASDVWNAATASSAVRPRTSTSTSSSDVAYSAVQVAHGLSASKKAELKRTSSTSANASPSEMQSAIDALNTEISNLLPNLSRFMRPDSGASSMSARDSMDADVVAASEHAELVNQAARTGAPMPPPWAIFSAQRREQHEAASKLPETARVQWVSYMTSSFLQQLEWCPPRISKWSAWLTFLQGVVDACSNLLFSDSLSSQSLVSPDFSSDESLRMQNDVFEAFVRGNGLTRLLKLLRWLLAFRSGDRAVLNALSPQFGLNINATCAEAEHSFAGVPINSQTLSQIDYLLIDIAELLRRIASKLPSRVKLPGESTDISVNSLLQSPQREFCQQIFSNFLPQMFATADPTWFNCEIKPAVASSEAPTMTFDRMVPVHLSFCLLHIAAIHCRFNAASVMLLTHTPTSSSTDQAAASPPVSSGRESPSRSRSAVQSLVGVGFDSQQSAEAFRRHQNIDQALHSLLVGAPRRPVEPPQTAVSAELTGLIASSCKAAVDESSVVFEAGKYDMLFQHIYSTASASKKLFLPHRIPDATERMLTQTATIMSLTSRLPGMDVLSQVFASLPADFARVFDDVRADLASQTETAVHQRYHINMYLLTAVLKKEPERRAPALKLGMFDRCLSVIQFCVSHASVLFPEVNSSTAVNAVSLPDVLDPTKSGATHALESLLCTVLHCVDLLLAPSNPLLSQKEQVLSLLSQLLYLQLPTQLPRPLFPQAQAVLLHVLSRLASNPDLALRLACANQQGIPASTVDSTVDHDHSLKLLGIPVLLRQHQLSCRQAGAHENTLHTHQLNAVRDVLKRWVEDPADVPSRIRMELRSACLSLLKRGTNPVSMSVFVRNIHPIIERYPEFVWQTVQEFCNEDLLSLQTANRSKELYVAIHPDSSKFKVQSNTINLEKAEAALATRPFKLADHCIWHLMFAVMRRTHQIDSVAHPDLLQMPRTVRDAVAMHAVPRVWSVCDSFVDSQSIEFSNSSTSQWTSTAPLLDLESLLSHLTYLLTLHPNSCIEPALLFRVASDSSASDSGIPGITFTSFVVSRLLCRPAVLAVADTDKQEELKSPAANIMSYCARLAQHDKLIQAAQHELNQVKDTTPPAEIARLTQSIEAYSQESKNLHAFIESYQQRQKQFAAAEQRLREKERVSLGKRATEYLTHLFLSSEAGASVVILTLSDELKTLSSDLIAANRALKSAAQADHTAKRRRLSGRTPILSPSSVMSPVQEEAQLPAPAPAFFALPPFNGAQTAQRLRVLRNALLSCVIQVTSLLSALLESRAFKRVLTLLMLDRGLIECFGALLDELDWSEATLAKKSNPGGTADSAPGLMESACYEVLKALQFLTRFDSAHDLRAMKVLEANWTPPAAGTVVEPPPASAQPAQPATLRQRFLSGQFGSNNWSHPGRLPHALGPPLRLSRHHSHLGRAQEDQHHDHEMFRLFDDADHRQGYVLGSGLHARLRQMSGQLDAHMNGQVDSDGDDDAPHEMDDPDLVDEPEEEDEHNRADRDAMLAAFHLGELDDELIGDEDDQQSEQGDHSPSQSDQGSDQADESAEHDVDGVDGAHPDLQNVLAAAAGLDAPIELHFEIEADGDEFEEHMMHDVIQRDDDDDIVIEHNHMDDGDSESGHEHSHGDHDHSGSEESNSEEGSDEEGSESESESGSDHDIDQSRDQADAAHGEHSHDSDEEDDDGPVDNQEEDEILELIDMEREEGAAENEEEIDDDLLVEGGFSEDEEGEGEEEEGDSDSQGDDGSDDESQDEHQREEHVVVEFEGGEQHGQILDLSLLRPARRGLSGSASVVGPRHDRDHHAAWQRQQLLAGLVQQRRQAESNESTSTRALPLSTTSAVALDRLEAAADALMQDPTARTASINTRPELTSPASTSTFARPSSISRPASRQTRHVSIGGTTGPSNFPSSAHTTTTTSTTTSQSNGAQGSPALLQQQPASSLPQRHQDAELVHIGLSDGRGNSISVPFPTGAEAALTIPAALPATLERFTHSSSSHSGSLGLFSSTFSDSGYPTVLSASESMASVRALLPSTAPTQSNHMSRLQQSRLYYRPPPNALMDSGVDQGVRQRWAELRTAPVSEEQIGSNVALFERLARQRIEATQSSSSSGPSQVSASEESSSEDRPFPKLFMFGDPIDIPAGMTMLPPTQVAAPPAPAPAPVAVADNVVPEASQAPVADTDNFVPEGIDPEVFQELPEELRRELIDQARSNRQAAAAASVQAPPPPALPPAQQSSSQPASNPGEYSAAAFLDELPADVREDVLLNSEPSMLATFPPHIQAEAHALRRRRMGRMAGLESIMDILPPFHGGSGRPPLPLFSRTQSSTSSSAMVPALPAHWPRERPDVKPAPVGPHWPLQGQDVHCIERAGAPLFPLMYHAALLRPLYCTECPDMSLLERTLFHICTYTSSRRRMFATLMALMVSRDQTQLARLHPSLPGREYSALMIPSVDSLPGRGTTPDLVLTRLLALMRYLVERKVELMARYFLCDAITCAVETELLRLGDVDEEETCKQLYSEARATQMTDFSEEKDEREQKEDDGKAEVRSRRRRPQLMSAVSAGPIRSLFAGPRRRRRSTAAAAAAGNAIESGVAAADGANDPMVSDIASDAGPSNEGRASSNATSESESVSDSADVPHAKRRRPNSDAANSQSASATNSAEQSPEPEAQPATAITVMVKPSHINLPRFSALFSMFGSISSTTSQSQNAEDLLVTLQKLLEYWRDSADVPAFSSLKPTTSLMPAPPRPAPEIPAAHLSTFVGIVLSDRCSDKQFKDAVFALVKQLATLSSNRQLLIDELVRTVAELGAAVEKHLNAMRHDGHERLSAADWEMVATQPRILRAVRLLQLLLSSNDEQASPVRLIDVCQLDLLWSALDRALSRAVDNDSEAATAAADAAAAAANTSTTSTASKRKAKAGERLTIGLDSAMRLLPLVQAYFVVNSVEREEKDKSSPSPSLTSAAQRQIGSFWHFCETHRRVLNAFVRHQPELLRGSLTALLKHPKKILDFENKTAFFRGELRRREQEERRRAERSSHSIRLVVRRAQAFEDSFQQFRRVSKQDVHGRLSVKFQGEEGVDAGGVTREWYLVMSRQIFNPNYALFRPSSTNSNVFQPNPLSYHNSDHLEFFQFIGRFIGKAIYDGQLIDAYFTRSFYKHILGLQPSFADMESVDPEFHKSLQWMLDNPIENVLEETFSVEIDDLGTIKTVDLVPDGRNKPVTDNNKDEYVRLVTEQRLTNEIREPINYFCRGFFELIPQDLIAMFNEQEMELLTCGLPEIDVDDMRANCEYRGFNESHPAVQWFWQLVREFDREERALLLQFVTGTSRVPARGFAYLQGMHGPQRFALHAAPADDSRLPVSHTCFNQLDLPQYSSRAILRDKLMYAIHQGAEGFGFQ